MGRIKVEGKGFEVQGENLKTLSTCLRLCLKPFTFYLSVKLFSLLWP